MWEQNYTPLFGSVAISALAASTPIFVVLLMLGIFRKPAWMAALAGLASALLIAIGVYGMPTDLALSATTFGAAFPATARKF